METGKTFSEMVAENAAAAAAPEEPVVENQAAQEAAADATQATDGASGGETPAAPTAPADPFIAWLAERGYDVADVDPQDMYLQVEAGLQELQRKDAELEELRRRLQSQPSEPAPAQAAAPAQASEPAQETAAQKLARKLAPLAAPDQTLLALVEKQDGVWVPKSGYGAEAVKAAEVVNAYQTEKNRRAEKLLEDPFSLIGDDLEAMVRSQAESLFEERMRKLQEEQEAARQRQAQEEAAKTHEQRREEFYQNHKDKIFVLDSAGNPRRVLNTNSYSISASGEKYFSELNRLQQKFPGADELALMEEALANVARSQPQPAPAVHVPVMAAAPAAPAQPVRTPEQARQEYVAQNRTSVAQVPSQGTPVATMEQRAAVSRGPRRFRDMVYEDPANADNPALSAR